MTNQSPFVLMRGLDVLAFLRDSVADEAGRKRSFIVQCEKLAAGSTTAEDRQRVRALEGCADALTFLIGAGQDARLVVERNGRKQDILDLMTKVANQARVALIEEKPDLDAIEEKQNTILVG